MLCDIVFKNTPPISSFIERTRHKITACIEKYALKKGGAVLVVVSYNNRNYHIHISCLEADGYDLYVEADGKDLFSACDLAIHKLVMQIKKHKNKVKDHRLPHIVGE